MTDTDGKRVRPFLKWAGNKYSIAGRIRDLLPPGHRLIEPFVGSGATFLNTRYSRYLLADSNPDLIHLYRILQKEGDKFIRACAALFTPENNCADAYYDLRDEFNACTNQRRRAILFLYLNRHGYNGLCRYSKKGGFNVPFGSHVEPRFPAREMTYFHQRADAAEFLCQDFSTTLTKAQDGDVVYCDPPYVPLSPTASFTAYASGDFAFDQQRQLAELARATAARGIPVLLSNHATDITEKLYAGAHITQLQVQRLISRDGDNRGKASELLALFTP